MEFTREGLKQKTKEDLIIIILKFTRYTDELENAINSFRKLITTHKKERNKENLKELPKEGLNKEDITSEVMHQYETIRSSGVCNMFDYYNVHDAAVRLYMHALASLSYEDYKMLLMNFNFLMKKYNIKQ